MPKKHQPNYNKTKPSYVHPSLQSSKSSSASTPTSPQSVSERIQQLRREAAPRATTERRDEVTDVVTRRSVPPALRRILHIAEVDAPAPKPGSRFSRAPRTGARPPPGPAAPSSWLDASRHAPDYLRKLRKKWHGEDGSAGLEKLSMLARVCDEEYKRLPPNPSLIHSTLKTFAVNFADLIEYEQYYVPALPVPLKEALLSYLSLYAPKGSLTFKSFKILFSTDKEVEGATGSEDIRFLDLTNLMSEGFSLGDLNKCLTRSFPTAASVTGGLKDLSLDTVNKGKEKAASIDIVESWEDEADEADEAIVAPLPSTLSVPLFPKLTRLSLAHPGSWASWSDLLNVSPTLKTITHLSLAYWPVPSTTPNAATTSMVSKHKTIALGGSSFYSELDDDWHEAANILRRLSQNTYCLRWLDLEGCTWNKALTWDLPSNPRLGSLDFLSQNPDEWARPTSTPGPDWNGAWRQIEYLNLFQGWIPSDQRSIMAMPAGLIPVQLLNWLREHREEEEWQDKLKFDTGHAVTEWIDREKVARNVGFAVHQLRKAAGGKWCKVDYGWEPFVEHRPPPKEESDDA
ncbi:hypothetical protein BDV96DRAFT_495224 [Lophiotrema nucula]|uniref:Tafazzin n=1 Tax=Lophiotrema nucula TaxID=690887 RepID=A0A6A5Z724_9PLEO|nr:hypothetical protein BDV96DRAFT_495224 [Lophiotrema nucula]